MKLSVSCTYLSEVRSEHILYNGLPFEAQTNHKRAAQKVSCSGTAQIRVKPHSMPIDIVKMLLVSLDVLVQLRTLVALVPRSAAYH